MGSFLPIVNRDLTRRAKQDLGTSREMERKGGFRPPSSWLQEWKWPRKSRFDRNLQEVPLKNTSKGPRVVVSMQRDERADKRMINEFLRQARKIRAWVRMVHLNSSAFKLDKIPS